MDNVLKVSVVIAVLNGERFIKDAVESVLSQTYPNIELVVKDGGSKDETLKILQNYSDRIVLVAQKDSGVYDAWNQGLRVVSGDVVSFLGSDDIFAYPGAMEDMIEKMESSGADSGWGDLIYVNREDSSNVVRRWVSSEYAPRKFQRGWHPPHPTFFVRRKVFEMYGDFRTDLRIAGDYEFMLRVLERYKISSCYLPKTMVTMRLGGMSNQPKAILGEARRESRRAWELNGLSGGFLASLLKPISKIKQLWTK